MAELKEADKIKLLGANYKVAEEEARRRRQTDPKSRSFVSRVLLRWRGKPAT